jgi:hypothetical protein
MTKKEKWLIHLRWFFMHVPINIFAFLTSYFLVPFAILLEKTKLKWLLWIYMDDGRYNDKTPTGYAIDYENWLNDGRGGSETFKNLYLWHADRNRMKNLTELIGKRADEYLLYLIKNTLIHKEQKVKISDENGLIKWENFAGLKWCNKNGDCGWNVHSGVRISWDHSFLGTASYYFRMLNKIFYRYTTCYLIENKIAKIFVSVIFLPIKFKWLYRQPIYFTLKYGQGRNGTFLSIKLQYEKI